ncbi:MAG: hypothetical protein Fur0023_18800 [Bacteroidia bacterium]
MIKKAEIWMLCAFVLYSCHPSNNENTSAHQTEQQSITTGTVRAQSNDSTEKTKMFKQIDNDVVFMASGTEPGWILALYKDKFLFVHNYGQDTVEDKLTSELQFPYTFQSDKLSFAIDKKNCIAISGDTLSYFVKVKHQDKELIGCGKMMK